MRYCQKTCDYGRRMLAKEVARRIFNRYFKADTKDFEVIRKVIPKLKSLTKAELNDEVLDNELVACVKVQLFRKIKYGTKIKIHDVTIRDNLKKA